MPALRASIVLLVPHIDLTVGDFMGPAGFHSQVRVAHSISAGLRSTNAGPLCTNAGGRSTSGGGRYIDGCVCCIAGSACCIAGGACCIDGGARCIDGGACCTDRSASYLDRGRRFPRLCRLMCGRSSAFRNAHLDSPGGSAPNTGWRSPQRELRRRLSERHSLSAHQPAQPQKLSADEGRRILSWVSQRGSSPTVSEGAVRDSGRMKIAHRFIGKINEAKHYSCRMSVARP
jgi:hypothetical protein